MSDSMTEFIEGIVDLVTRLGVFLPFAIVLLLRMFSGKAKSQGQPQQPQPQRQPPRQQQRPSQPSSPQPATTGEPIPIPGFPFAPPAWMEMGQPSEGQRSVTTRQPARPESQWGHTFDRNDDREEEVLKWGSAFDDNDDEPAKWDSIFNAQQGKTKYGFEKAEWGNTFPQKSSEPVVQVG